MFNEKTQMYDGIIYCFTNKINNKKYVGQTQQTLNCLLYTSDAADE